MNPRQMLDVIDTINRERGVPRETIFGSIEKAVRLAIMKCYDDEDGVQVTIDRNTGQILAQKGDKVLEPNELGRIAASSAKQMIIQSIREEESNTIFNLYAAQKGDLVAGNIQRFEGGAGLVNLGKTEALLPRSEQIPGESHHVGERVKAVISEVKRQGHRVKIVLSRTHPEFVRRLFEEEIPEIKDGTISIKAVAREAGYRSKVAVSSIDMKVDCVGACVGVRGSRIKNIVDELGGERIDIVRWNESLQVLIPNALQPAEIEEVFLYSRLGRAVVLVKEDQLSLAIGRRGQNVRLASKLVGWDIEIMTHDELNESIEKAIGWFLRIPGVSEELAEAFIEEGFLSYDDLTFLEPAQHAELFGITEDLAEQIIEVAEEAAETVEEEVRASKAAAEAERRASGISAPSRSSSTASAVEKLFSEPVAAAPVEPKRTIDQLFGPAAPEPAPEPPLSAAQVFSDPPAPSAEPAPVPAEEQPASAPEAPAE